MSNRVRGWRKVAIASWRSPNDPTSYGLKDVDATAILAYLDRVNATQGVKVTLLTVVVKALGHAMAIEPNAASRLSFGRMIPRKTMDIFVQVDRGKGQDLSGIKLKDVTNKSIIDLASEVVSRAGSVRSETSEETLRRAVSVTDHIPGFLMPLALGIQDMLSNDLCWKIPALGVYPDPFGVAMVTNIGSLGLDIALPPIPPICRCVLVIALGQITQRPMVVDGEVVARPVFTMGIAGDHRYIDGAQASKMAQVLDDIFRDPARHFGEYV